MTTTPTERAAAVRRRCATGRRAWIDGASISAVAREAGVAPAPPTPTTPRKTRCPCGVPRDEGRQTKERPLRSTVLLPDQVPASWLPIHHPCEPTRACGFLCRSNTAVPRPRPSGSHGRPGDDPLVAQVAAPDLVALLLPLPHHVLTTSHWVLLSGRCDRQAMTRINKTRSQPPSGACKPFLLGARKIQRQSAAYRARGSTALRPEPDQPMVVRSGCAGSRTLDPWS